MVKNIIVGQRVCICLPKISLLEGAQTSNQQTSRAKALNLISVLQKALIALTII
jgi:hypothetical protein